MHERSRLFYKPSGCCSSIAHDFYLEKPPVALNQYLILEVPLSQPGPLGREQVLKAAESPLAVHRRHGSAPEASNDIGILSDNVWDCIATQNGTHPLQLFVAWVLLQDLFPLGLELRDGQALIHVLRDLQSLNERQPFLQLRDAALEHCEIRLYSRRLVDQAFVLVDFLGDLDGFAVVRQPLDLVLTGIVVAVVEGCLKPCSLLS